MKCIYATGSLDSLCAAAIVKMKFDDCELYGQASAPIPDDMIEPGEDIYLVGSVLPLADIQKIASVGRLIWFNNTDEAKKLKDEFLVNSKSKDDNFLFNAKAGSDSDTGICPLVWDELYKDLERPKAVTAISRALHPDIYDYAHYAELCACMALYPCSPDDHDFWGSVFNPDEKVYKEMTALGSILLRVKAHADALTCRLGGFYTEIDGLRCVALNSISTTERTFGSIYNPEHHDLMVSFGLVSGRWLITFYSPNGGMSAKNVASRFSPDLSPHATKRQASFSVDDLIIPLPAIPEQEESDVSK